MIGPMPAGYADQPLATCVPARNGFDLFRQTLDALVEPAPVSCQIFNDAHHAWRQGVRGRSENVRQLGTQRSAILAEQQHHVPAERRGSG
jgi:hypothetical protein